MMSRKTDVSVERVSSMKTCCTNVETETLRSCSRPISDGARETDPAMA